MIAKVEPLTTARALRGPFDYRLPGGMGQVGKGSMLLVPFGRQRLLGVVTGLAHSSDVPPEKLAEPFEALEHSVPPELIDLGLWTAEEYCSTPARGLTLVLPPGSGRTRTKRRLVADLVPGADPEGARPPLGARQREVLAALAGGARPAAELGGHAALRSLERRGLVTLHNTEQRRRPEHRAVGASGPAPEPTAAQRAALAEIVAAMGGEGDPRLLLHGVTGSGKTEVYLGAVAAALERGRSAIVLVPEIALTPQTVARFQRRFGDTVAVLHSKLGAGERHDEWLRLRRGEARVCVGPRSAVFAPLADLGLVVIDEEHDPSYKQDGDPRYDARRVAAKRAEQAGAVVVAGTATPRPESWRRLRRVEMPERVDGRALPPVELVGMPGVSGALHPRTREALERVRVREEKAIVLLNRRGWSNFLTCQSCARVWMCPSCDVSLVLHRAAGAIACHHCGHRERLPRACPDCGSVSLARHGAGTERLEHELVELMAPLPVLRLDSDAAAGRGAMAGLLARFDAAPAGVLVGTQMVAKGHDFPDVTLGVVLDADSTLRFPDFRAEERTFALVAQLAGRSGRGRRGGRVIVQALQPDAPCLGHAARHDAPAFLAEELERREALSYPPFSHLVRVVCSSDEGGPQLAASEALRDALSGLDAGILGPAPLFRLKGRERSQLVLKADDRAGTVAAVGRAVESLAGLRAHRGVSWAVDVDPQ
ncbi:MAG: primosomal protein N' [Thermoleophilaceae bacterium]